MPEETYMVMVVPLGTDWPAAGSVFVTISLAMSALSSVLTVAFTLNPALSRMLRASSWLRSLTSGT